jgi:type IV pilus assembly protein PilO
MALDVKAYFANIPRQQMLLMVAVLFVGAGAVFYFLPYKPLLEENARLAKEMSTLEARLRESQFLGTQRDRLEQEIKRLEAQLLKALVRLPEEKEIAGLLTQVAGLSQQSGLDILAFTPKTPTPKDFYAEVPIQLTVEGTFHSLGAFLDRVGRLERLVTITDLRVSPVPRSAERRSPHTITADFTAMTYTFSGKEAAPAAGARR